MAAFHWILLLLSVSLLPVAGRKSRLSKRSIIELAGTVECSTGRSALAYIMYGCYCGLGGQGWPIDEADWCCFRHDCCYGEAESLGCQTKTDPYHWMCKDHTPECDDPEEPCKRQLCKCDKELAKCLKEALYNKANTDWPDFLCLGKGPSCDDKDAS